MTRPEWDVVIAGAGPCGLTLANLLGAARVRTLVLEQLPELIDYPRAINFDDESLRTFQAIGLAAEVRRHTVPDQLIRFVDRDWRVILSVEPYARPFGWPIRNAMIQPLVDRELHVGLGRHVDVDVRFATSVIGFEERDDGIVVRVDDGEPITARYLVGCDGGRSTVRHELGLAFDGVTDSTRWCVIDVADDPVGRTNSGLVLDDDFPHVSTGLPHGVRRFEFMVPPDADAAAYDDPAEVQRLLARVLPPGVRPHIIRSRVYTHHGRIASTFGRGRVLLAGDAAHLMPVWQGQGYNSGIRDAANLGWKLAMVVQGRAEQRLLHTYTQERLPHARAMIDLSVLVGRIFVPSNRGLRWLRNTFLYRLIKIGPIRRYLTEFRFKPMPFFKEGAVVHRGTPDPASRVGRLFIQPTVVTAEGEEMRLDDVIGPRFALLTWGARADAWIDERSRRILEHLDAVSVVVRPDCQALDRDPPVGGVVVGSADGVCKKWFDDAVGSVVVLRPDRVVAAACQPHELDATLAVLAQRLGLVVADPVPA